MFDTNFLSASSDQMICLFAQKCLIDQTALSALLRWMSLTSRKSNRQALLWFVKYEKSFKIVREVYYHPLSSYLTFSAAFALTVAQLLFSNSCWSDCVYRSHTSVSQQGPFNKHVTLKTAFFTPHSPMSHFVTINQF